MMFDVGTESAELLRVRGTHAVSEERPIFVMIGNVDRLSSVRNAHRV